MAEIRVIEAPSVYLIGYQQVDPVPLQAFLKSIDASGWTTDAISPGEKLVETAGRVCYESFRKPRPGGNAAYIAHILAVGHGSVTEHEVFNFIITGVSRSLTHQLERHRAGWSYSELSQRFVDAGDFAFVLPPSLIESWRIYEENCAAWQYAEDWKRVHMAAIGSWRRAIGESLSIYSGLVQSIEEIAAQSDQGGDATLRRKRARESARSVLPECTETKIFVTANARALRTMLELRGSEHADAEIRRLALAMLAVLVPASPHIFGDYTIAQVDGVDVIRTDYRKV